MCIETILTRRSIRRFSKRMVDEKDIKEMLRAAMAAPSAGNEQPWHFVVVSERKLLERIPDFHPHAAMCRQAAAAILVCADPGLEKHPGYWVQDLAAATQNILLAAHAIGLGAVWVGIHPRSEREDGMRRLLQLPPQIIPFALVPFGDPAENIGPAERFDPSRIHHNCW